jgi:hypothetical protein
VVLSIADYLGYRMTPHQLRPDLYPNPTDALPPGVSPTVGADTPAPEPHQEAA